MNVYLRNFVYVLIFSMVTSLSSASYGEMEEVYGNFGGLGVELELKGELPRITGIIDGSPASKSGLEEDDILTHVDGKSLKGMGLVEIVEITRGEPGSQAELVVMREGDEMPLAISIKRQILKKPDNFYTRSNDYIRIVVILIILTLVVLFWLAGDKRKK